MFTRILKFFRGTASTSTSRDAPSTSANPCLTKSSKIVIVGSGCFGISTALHLLKRGYKDVTILERASELPAADAASTDINKSESLKSLLLLASFRFERNLLPLKFDLVQPTLELNSDDLPSDC